MAPGWTVAATPASVVVDTGPALPETDDEDASVTGIVDIGVVGGFDLGLGLADDGAWRMAHGAWLTIVALRRIA